MRRSPVCFLLVSLISVSILSSCNEEAAGSPVQDLASIVGIYDWSDDYGTDGVDEWYLGIDAEGYISDYDYYGDSYDMGSNCYYINLNWERLTHISGNRFGTETMGEVVITKTSGGGLIADFDDPQIFDLVLGKKTSLVQSDLVAADCNTGVAVNSRRTEDKSSLKTK